jgi:hypothetical protein
MGARGGKLHEGNHPVGRKDRGEAVLGREGDRAGGVALLNHETDLSDVAGREHVMTYGKPLQSSMVHSPPTVSRVASHPGGR